ncbi:MAG TPA: 2-dehydro-3-deoxygalactonokinase, partial [Sphingomicrobium sp.]|nr:2-dehydro-3-deoxygalactonokinase [Sphingomicrobium sp.]
EFEDGKGALSVPKGEFPAAVAEIRERLGDLPLLLAGMAGSNRGWVDAPYLPCPVGIDDLVKNLVWAGEREAIIPGVSFIGQGRADVMRGEEVQLLGGVAAGLINPEGFVCHPGTHNKWVLLRHGTIHIFGTVMTGELFNLLKEHSILADLLQGPVEPNEAFKRGVRRAMKREMLSADLFGVRAGVLLGQTSKDDAPSFTSGLLIGADVRIGLTWPASARIGVIGRPELTRLYAAAIAETGREAIELDGERCFLAGIQQIAERI